MTFKFVQFVVLNRSVCIYFSNSNRYLNRTKFFVSGVFPRVFFCPGITSVYYTGTRGTRTMHMYMGGSAVGGGALNPPPPPHGPADVSLFSRFRRRIEFACISRDDSRGLVAPC